MTSRATVAVRSAALPWSRNRCERSRDIVADERRDDAIGLALRHHGCRRCGRIGPNADELLVRRLELERRGLWMKCSTPSALARRRPAAIASSRVECFDSAVVDPSSRISQPSPAGSVWIGPLVVILRFPCPLAVPTRRGRGILSSPAGQALFPNVCPPATTFTPGTRGLSRATGNFLQLLQAGSCLADTPRSLP